jgi:hypothetical protein
MPLVHWIADVMTGQKDLPVWPIENQNWARVFRGDGDGSHTFAVLLSKYSRETWRDLLKDDWSRVLVIAWEDVNDPTYNRVLYAGVITGADPNDDGTVTAHHTEITTFLDARLSFTDLDEGPFVVGGRSYRGQILQALVRFVVGPRRALPLYFAEYDEMGSAPDIVANTYDVMTIQEIIDNVTKAADAPDWELRPQWSYESTLQWGVRVGNPRLTGPLLEFNATAFRPGQIRFAARTDGAKRATKVWAVGKGSEADMRIGRADLGGTSPALERVRSFKDEADINKLNSLALGEARAFAGSTVQPTLVVPLKAAMAQGFEFGSQVRLLFEGHWWWEDAPQMFELIGYGMSGNPEELELQVRRL